MFFIAYAFKGQVHVFAGRVKIVSHSSSSEKILSPDTGISQCQEADPCKHIIAGYHWLASEMPLKWRFAGRPMVAQDCMRVGNYCLNDIDYVMSILR